MQFRRLQDKAERSKRKAVASCAELCEDGFSVETRKGVRKRERGNSFVTVETSGRYSFTNRDAEERVEQENVNSKHGYPKRRGQGESVWQWQWKW